MKPRFHKLGILLGGVICCAFSFAWGGPDAIPHGYAVERYAPLWQHSPFTISSAVQPEAAAPGFAADLAVVAIARIDNDNWVTFFNKHTQERFSVGGDPDEQGMKVVSVETDPDPMKTKVTLQKGAETATVGFDKSLLALTQTPPPPAAMSAAQLAAAQEAREQDPADPNIAPLPPPVRRQRRLPPIPTGAPTPPITITNPNPP